MKAAESISAEIDFADIQGLVRFGHGKLQGAEFLLLDVADAAAARDWLRSVPVTSAEWQEPPPESAVQIAFTADGLRALGLAPNILDQFEQPFLAGMAGEESRSRRLGDVGANAPDIWGWGSPPPHLLLMLYARPGELEALKATLLVDRFDHAFRLVRSLSTNTLRGIEPFGFADGISDGEFQREVQRR